ncbi:hypothetical protein [Paenibacillus pini]|uniref:Uncharacterized protein n=2 Tax=Paenibacillus TaxID=44249 RepID=W7YEC7_9BACL|nr:hypothetical protein JCM16418_3406 [Paenibacillus pini JCM 16418]
MKNAQQIFDKIVTVYGNRKDIYDRYSKKNMFQAMQKIGDDTLLIVVSINSDWWSPWKGSVTEDVYYYKED